MEFDEWIKDEELKVRKILFQLHSEKDKVITQCHSREEQEMHRRIFAMSITVERRRSAELNKAISCKKIISKIEELIAKKQKLEAGRAKATDIDKELLLAEIEQTNDQLAEARKEYIKCKPARDKLMKEYSKSKEVAA